MTRIIGWTVVALAAALALVPTALAKDRDVEVRGTCTGPSRAELDLDYDDGGIEVELEIDQNRSGVRWQVVLWHDGKRVASRTAVTRGRSGSFETHFLTANRAGIDRFTARATRPGERCVARAAIG